MAKDFSIDFSSLDTTIHKKAFRFSDVKDRLETVAFDIVRFKDGDEAANLWQVQSADDGDYIVALYQEDKKDISKTASTKLWSVFVQAGNLHISYKGEPLLKMTASKLGIPPTELSQASSYLPNKLASSPKLVKALLKELPLSTKNSVLNKYPELAQ